MTLKVVSPLIQYSSFDILYFEKKKRYLVNLSLCFTGQVESTLSSVTMEKTKEQMFEVNYNSQITWIFYFKSTDTLVDAGICGLSKNNGVGR